MFARKMGTWLYLMMEKYGQSTRKEVLAEYGTSKKQWEKLLFERVKTTDRYDLEIELCADYRPQNNVRSKDVFKSIASIKQITVQNALYIAQANCLVSQAKDNDFPRRF